MTATDKDKIRMALDRLALLEAEIRDGHVPESLSDFAANMRLRLEHGVPGDTIACFARDDA